MATKSKCPFLQQQHDEKQFGSSYYFITQVKGLDAAHKLLLITMCDNVWLNGQVDWSQKSYAIKTGTSRSSIISHFKKYIELGILEPAFDNKKGSKATYTLVYRNIKKLVKPAKPIPKKKSKASKSVPEDDNGPVKPARQATPNGPVKPARQDLSSGLDTNLSSGLDNHLSSGLDTYNNGYNKNNIHNGDDESSFRNDSPSQPKETKKPELTPEAIIEWANLEL